MSAADLKYEVLVHSTAEFLAKRDEYSQSGLDYYLNLAAGFHAGDKTRLPEDQAAAIRLHELMLSDDEAGAIEQFPEIGRQIADSDERQVIAATGPKNLDYFRRHGVEYEFDENQAENMAKLVRPDRLLTAALMRENIVSASGYENVRLNYIYHDVMDHVWLFDFMQSQGVYGRYQDYLSKVGDPFQGNLMSRESELISGIGFTSRRYLADPECYGRMSLRSEDLIALLSSEGNPDDARISDAIKVISTEPEIAEWSGFVIKDAIANIVSQRAKRGAVKILTKDEQGEYASTGEPTSLFDPVYLALIVETVAALAENRDDYIAAQTKLNVLIETILMDYVSTGRAIGSLMLDQSVNTGSIDEDKLKILQTDIGLSTSYFEK